MEKKHRHLIMALLIAALLVIFFLLLPAETRQEMIDRLRPRWLTVSMLLLFGMLSLSLLWAAGNEIDRRAFLFVNLKGHRPPWLDGLFFVLTQLGSGITALGLAAAFYFYGRRSLAYEIVLGSLTLWLVVELIKALIRRARPFEDLTQARVVGLRAIGRSFPSGHTSQAFFLATLMVRHTQWGFGLAILFYLLAAVVGVTRMYVGAHYPRDVLAGALLGTVWGILGVYMDVYIFS
jgi:membrane-associated phospholipid phosphatase